VREHVADPVQFRVHPPLGHWMLHELFPPQLMVDPVPTFIEHWLPPLQVVLQFDAHEPEQDDCPSHVVVQPVPQFVLHVFFEVQS
jgi:hypothetical protein